MRTVSATREATLEDLLEGTRRRVAELAGGWRHDDRDQVGLRAHRGRRATPARGGVRLHRGRDLARRARRAARVRQRSRRVRRAPDDDHARRVRVRTPSGPMSSVIAAPSASTRHAPSSRPLDRRASVCACTAISSPTAARSPSPSISTARASTTARILEDSDIDLLSGSATVATLLPGAEFSTRSPYPSARRLLDADVTVALATDCNPGSSYVTSMGFIIALAVREMNMTVDEALWAATKGGALALRCEEVGHLGRRRARRLRDSRCAARRTSRVPTRWASGRRDASSAVGISWLADPTPGFSPPDSIDPARRATTSSDPVSRPR